MAAAKRTVKRKDALPGRILDTAVELAEESGWGCLWRPFSLITVTTTLLPTLGSRAPLRRC